MFLLTQWTWLPMDFYDLFCYLQSSSCLLGWWTRFSGALAFDFLFCLVLLFIMFFGLVDLALGLYFMLCHPHFFGNTVWTSGPGIIRALGLYFVIVGLVDLVFRGPGILFSGFVCHPKNLYHVWYHIENHAQESGRPKREMPPIVQPKVPIASWLFCRDTLLIHNPKTCNWQDYYYFNKYYSILGQV